MLKQLIDHVVKELIDRPDLVDIQVNQEASQVIIQIKVPLDDFKRIIGKEGRVIKAIRTMAIAVNPNPEKHVVVDVVK